MSVLIKPVPRKNPQDQTAPAKYYAHVVNGEKVSIDQLARFVAKTSTMSRADCYGVMVAMVEAAVEELLRGNAIDLGFLGSFRIVVNSEGVETESEVNESLIKRAKLHFTPAKDFKDALKVLTYHRAASISPPEDNQAATS